MKVGDLVKTKVSILNNRIAKDRLGLIVSKRKVDFSEYSYNIMKVKFSGEQELFAYKERHLEVVSEQ
tara:strand:+ start:442 stop:642 length:201 start_codon:yes stop_codon:yes gene_type:complete